MLTSASFETRLLRIVAVTSGCAVLFFACGQDPDLVSSAAPESAPTVSAPIGNPAAVSAPIGNPEAATVCLEQALAFRLEELGRIDGLVAAFSTSAGKVVEWQETRHGPDGPRIQSRFRSRPATERVTLCYFDGLFGGFPKGPPDAAGNSPRPYDRVAVLIPENGEPIVDVAGYRDRLALAAPNS